MKGDIERNTDLCRLYGPVHSERMLNSTEHKVYDFSPIFFMNYTIDTLCKKSTSEDSYSGCSVVAE